MMCVRLGILRLLLRKFAVQFNVTLAGDNHERVSKNGPSTYMSLVNIK